MVPGTRKHLTRAAGMAKLEVRNGRAVCPVCNRETYLRILPTTALNEFPLYCKLCKQTTTVHREPEP